MVDFCVLFVLDGRTVGGIDEMKLEKFDLQLLHIIRRTGLFCEKRNHND